MAERLRRRAQSAKTGPDGSLERAARARLAAQSIVCGVDEAGRGPLAGPVIAAAVAFAPHVRLADIGLEELNDSKALSAQRRSALYGALHDANDAGVAEIGVGAACVREIDALNILRANDLAMRRAVHRLPRRPAMALVDGNRTPPALGCAAEAVIGGDARSVSIAAASIIAKVIRDRIMALLARRHPGFGWERNAGYPTAEHRAALKRLGPSPHHRMTFKAVRETGAAAPTAR